MNEIFRLLSSETKILEGLRDIRKVAAEEKRTRTTPIQ